MLLQVSPAAFTTRFVEFPHEVRDLNIGSAVRTAAASASCAKSEDPVLCTADADMSRGREHWISSQKGGSVGFMCEQRRARPLHCGKSRGHLPHGFEDRGECLLRAQR